MILQPLHDCEVMKAAHLLILYWCNSNICWSNSCINGTLQYSCAKCLTADLCWGIRLWWKYIFRQNRSDWCPTESVSSVIRTLQLQCDWKLSWADGSSLYSWAFHSLMGWIEQVAPLHNLNMSFKESCRPSGVLGSHGGIWMEAFGWRGMDAWMQRSSQQASAQLSHVVPPQRWPQKSS